MTTDTTAASRDAGGDGRKAGIVLAAVYLQRRLGVRQATPWILAALILYGLGFLTTMAINMPLSSDLADAGDPSRIADLAGVRDAFEDKWVAWHIVRTVLSTAALGCLAYALLLHGRAEREPTQHKAGAGKPAARRRGAAARPRSVSTNRTIS